MALSSEDLQNVQRVCAVLIGESNCGKTTMVNRLISLSSGESSGSLLSNTLEPQLYTWTNSNTQLVLVDICGRQVYHDWARHLLQLYNQAVIVGVFDLTSSSSFATLRDRLSVLVSSKGTSVNAIGNTKTKIGPIGVIIGNKADLEDRRQVDAEEALQLARHLEMGYFECNSLTGSEALQPFQFLTEQLGGQLKKLEKKI